VATRRFADASKESLQALYDDVAEADLQPLWAQEAELMAQEPPASAVAHVWRWSVMAELARRAGHEVDFESGGDRRVLALCNPGLEGRPYATPTLWGGIQYLAPGEIAPAHRHTPGALRFVLEGQGVWTLVNGDPVAMNPGDLILTPGWAWHEHHNASSEPMIWFDGLDLPFVSGIDGTFFEQGDRDPKPTDTPAVSASEIRFGKGPGLIAPDNHASSGASLLAYRWEATDLALRARLADAEESHASVRFVDPTSGRDVFRTMRCEMHRLRVGHRTPTRQVAGSSLWVCVDGSAELVVDGLEFELNHGDIAALPSWVKFDMMATSEVTLFQVSDAPLFEAAGLDRTVQHASHQRIDRS